MSISETVLPSVSAAPKQSAITEANALWLIVGIMIAIDSVWLRLSGIGISFGPAFVVGLTTLAVLHLIYTRLRPNRRIAQFALTSMQLVAFTAAGTILVYLTVTSNFPLIDRQLETADAAMGFNWLTFFDWVKDRPAIDRALDIAYDSSIFEIFVLLVILNATSRFEQARHFVWLFVLTLLIIMFFAWLFPAESAWAHFGVADRVDAYHLADFVALRAGQLKEIALAKANGLITFPSFHAALGLILIIATRRTFLFPIFLPLNVAMIASALTSGGHYLIDIFAGLAVVPVAALIWRSLKRLTEATR
ncbi:phosphatase PAP2 family protein [Bradyrhizobium sp. 27S5]|uniref:phosphatase PAP2 family protein n=1 Tax=Bradyrhizobium sp. 27S5 TaxID=3139728 RepID=UPI0030CD4D08